MRAPAILMQQLKQQAHEILTISPQKTEKKENITRHSRCPYCQVKLKPWHNIPVVSYLTLKGKCAFCQHRISYQYPVVELLCAIIPTLICGYLGINISSLLLCLLFFFLVALSVIDLKHLFLPDQITLLLLWIGLFINIFNTFTTPSSAILGVIIGYAILWFFYWGFKLVTKKEGLGYGDFKLMAAIGAWFGIGAIPFVILTSSIIGILYALLLSLQKRQQQRMIPFGPCIALAGFIYPFIGHTLMHAYWSWVIM